jgi:hypothetical protein
MSLSSSRPTVVDPGGASTGTPGRKTRIKLVTMSNASVLPSALLRFGVVVRSSGGKSADSPSLPSSNLTCGPFGSPMCRVMPSRISTDDIRSLLTNIPFVLELSIATQ